MSTRHVDGSLDQATLDKILTGIIALRAETPFLIDLSVEDRKGMAKFGDKSRAFIDQAMVLVDQHPEILPPSFDVARFKADVALMTALYPIRAALQHYTGQVEDTFFAVSSSGYSGALNVYTLAKAANMMTATLEDALNEMSRRFAHHNSPAAAAKGSS